MTTDLTTIEVPSYAISRELANQLNADALGGISTGVPQSIRTKAGKFKIVDGSKLETILKPADLREGEFLDIVVLAAKPGLNKVYYAQAYDPNQDEAAAPDCFSFDGERPDSSVKSPQCSVCATCPMNAFGSGRNAAGQPTKGKACSDNKILAVLHKGGVYQFKIPPASLKNWGVFVKNLTARGVPISNVVVYVGFDDALDYSVFTFRIGNFIHEKLMGRVSEYATSPEVLDIIHPVVAAPAAPAKPVLAPVPTPAKTVEPAPVDDIFGDDPPEDRPAAKVEEIPKRGRPRAAKDEEDVVKKADALTDDEISKLLDL